MNSAQKLLALIFYRWRMSGFLLLVVVGVNYAVAGQGVSQQADSGIPGVLRYAQQYRSEETKPTEKNTKKTKASSEAVLSGQHLVGIGEQRRHLVLLEQELRQLKKENRRLRDSSSTVPAGANIEEKNVEQIKVLKAKLVSALAEIQQQKMQVENVKQTLNAQVSDLKQQLDQTGADARAVSERDIKEKKALESSLAALKVELAAVRAEKQKQQEMLTEKSELTKKQLNTQLSELKQQLVRTETENKAISERSGKEKAALTSSLAALKVELAAVRDEKHKQQKKLTENVGLEKKQLSTQISTLEQRLARAEADSRTASEKADKEKAELTSSLSSLKAELATMPLVTPDDLKSTAVQQTYAAGVAVGRDVLSLQAVQQQLGLKTDNRILVAGIRDALNRKVLLNESALNTALRQAGNVAQKARQAVVRKQKKDGVLFLEKFRKRKGVKKADSGFWYRIEYSGDGDLIKGENTVVDVVVTEKLTDGTVVEDMDMRGQVLSQTLGEYPPVFRSALMMMKNHGTMELVVPAELAYGDEGYPPKVPPGATMVYTLRVEEVKPVSQLSGSKTVKGQAGEKKSEGARR